MQATVNVRYDGSHYVAALTGYSKDPRDMTYAEFLNAQSRSHRYERRVKTDIEKMADNLYLCACYAGKRKKDEKIAYVVENLPDYFFPEEKREAAEKACVRRAKANKARDRRLNNKLYMTAWNYFVTFTYDSDIEAEDGSMMDEDTFRKRIRKTLSNFSTRKGWRYFGVPERAPKTGRLHFHLLLHIPEGEEVGTCAIVPYYSKKEGRWKERNENDFFRKNFGVNDFAPIDPQALRDGSVLGYLVKYLQKTDEPLFFSRHLPEKVKVTIDLEKDVICMTYNFYHWTLLLFDHVVEKEPMRDLREQIELQRRWCYGDETQAVA